MQHTRPPARRAPRSRRRPGRRTGLVAALVVALAVPAFLIGGTASATPPPGGHRVVAGETLSELADQLGTTVQRLAQANGIDDPNHIVVGQTITVPAPSATSSPVPRSRRHLGAAFDRWAAANGVPASLLKAMCFNESGWQAHVVSSAGADGVCQLMPDTEDHMEALIGRELDSRDAEDNIRLGARYLRWLLARTDGDVREAVAGYYQGLASVQRDGVYPETEAYVDTVLALRRRF